MWGQGHPGRSFHVEVVLGCWDERAQLQCCMKRSISPRVVCWNRGQTIPIEFPWDPVVSSAPTHSTFTTQSSASLCFRRFLWCWRSILHCATCSSQIQTSMTSCCTLTTVSLTMPSSDPMPSTGWVQCLVISPNQHQRKQIATNRSIIT